MESAGKARGLAAQAAQHYGEDSSANAADQAQTLARLQVLIEARAIWISLGGVICGALLGLVVFAESQPALSGFYSVQFYGAIVAGIVAATAFLLGYSLNVRMANIWLGKRPRMRQLIDVVALIIVHAAIAVMMTLGSFRLFQEAFLGLRVDHVSGSLLMAVIGGMAAYFSFNSGARLTAFSLSTLLAVFMASGVTVSMLFAENPNWWIVMFSELGTGQAGITSFWTFNTTLIVSGIIITTLTAFITKDLEVWAAYARDQVARRSAQRAAMRKNSPAVTKGLISLRTYISRHFSSPRLLPVRLLLIGMGISLAVVGLVPIHVHHDGHVLATASFGGLFLLLLLAVPYLLPGFPRSFYVFSYVAAAALIGALLLWEPVQYYNLTALELIATAVLFAWLIVFIRNIAALVERVRQFQRRDAANSRGPDGAAASQAMGVPPLGVSTAEVSS